MEKMDEEEGAWQLPKGSIKCFTNGFKLFNPKREPFFSSFSSWGFFLQTLLVLMRYKGITWVEVSLRIICLISISKQMQIPCTREK